jgi:hypothetical protein
MIEGGIIWGIRYSEGRTVVRIYEVVGFEVPFVFWAAASSQ